MNGIWLVIVGGSGFCGLVLYAALDPKRLGGDTLTSNDAVDARYREATPQEWEAIHLAAQLETGRSYVAKTMIIIAAGRDQLAGRVALSGEWTGEHDLRAFLAEQESELRRAETRLHELEQRLHEVEQKPAGDDRHTPGLPLTLSPPPQPG